MTEESTPAPRSALLSFTAGNVGSFRDEFTLSLVAERTAEPGVPRTVPWSNRGHTVDVLPVAGIFGANASGKSGVLRALHDLSSLVRSSFRAGDPDRQMTRRPFLLDGRGDRPTTYAAEAVIHGVRHRYSVTFDDSAVIAESAFHHPNGRSVLLFERDRQRVAFGASTTSAKGRAAIESLRPNALLLSVAAAVDHPELLPIFRFLRDLRALQAPLADHGETRLLLDDQNSRSAVLDLLRAADLGIRDVRLVPGDQARRNEVERLLAAVAPDEPISERVLELAVEKVELGHVGPSGITYLARDLESAGTERWFCLIGPLVRVLQSGAVLMVDELDASLHPSLVREVIAMFQDPDRNLRGAQLIFNAHDVTLLGEHSTDRVLGRDQVWFTEKGSDGASRLYPLTDFSVRKQEAVMRRYLEGHYGATPITVAGDFAVTSAE